MISPACTSRFAAGECKLWRKLHQLLRLLAVCPRRRAAQFRCASHSFLMTHTHLRGRNLPGVIVESPRGTGGFGYDPLFLPDGHTQTFGEMDLALKNTLSHRAHALIALKSYLRSIGW